MTHQGKYQAPIAGAAIVARAEGTPVDVARWGAHVATADHVAVPQVVFTTPEVASGRACRGRALGGECRPSIDRQDLHHTHPWFDRAYKNIEEIFLVMARAQYDGAAGHELRR